MIKDMEYRIFKGLGCKICRRENLKERVICLQVSEELLYGKEIVVSSM